MFFTFQKLTNSRASGTSLIVINQNAILMVASDTFELNNASYDTTRVEVIGFPQQTFHTQTTMDDIMSHMTSFDAIVNPITGSSLTPLIEDEKLYPLIKIQAIKNKNPNETSDFIFNPNYLVTAEEVEYATGHTGLMLSLRDIGPRQILAKLSVDELILLFDSVDIVNDNFITESEGGDQLITEDGQFILEE